MRRKWLLTGILAVLLLPVILLAAAVLFINVTDLSQHRDIIAQHVSKIAGRRLSLDGELALNIGPTSSIAVSDIALANAPSASTPEMLVIQRVEAEIELWPLLRGDVRIPRLYFAGAKIALETDASGTGNWVLAQPVDAPAESDARAAFKPPWIRDLSLANVELGYRDARTGRSVSAQIEHARVNTDTPASPTKIDIAGQVDGHPVEINGSIALPAMFAADALDLPMELDARVLGLQAVASGRISGSAPAPAIDFTLQAEAASLQQMRAVFGAAIPDLPAASLALEVKGEQAQPLSATLKATAGKATLDARLKLLRDPPRPKLTGKVSVGDIDAVQWWPSLFAGKPTTAVDAKKRATASQAPSQLEQPLRLAWLESLDLDLMVSAKRVSTPQLAITSLRSRLLIDDRMLSIDELELAAGAGTAKATVMLNAREKPPAVTVELTTSPLSLAKLQPLADNARFTHSRAEAKVSLASRGATARGLIRSVQGSVNLLYRDRQRKEEFTFSLTRAPEQTPVSLPRLVVTADGYLDRQTVQLRAEVVPPEHPFKRGGPYQIDLALQAFGISAKATGTAAAPDTRDGVDLAIEARAEELDGLQQLLGQDIPLAGAADLNARLRLQQSKWQLSKVRIGLADGRIEGWLALDTAAEIPDLRTELVFTDLNLPRLLSARAQQVEADQAAAVHPEKDARIFPNEPLPFAALQRANIKAVLRASNLVWHDHRRLEEAELRLDLSAGNLSASLVKLSAVRGELTAYFVVDTVSNDAPRLSLKLEVPQIELGEILTTADGTAAIEGPLAVTVFLEGQGQTVAQIMATLDGEVKMLLEQGRADAQTLDLFVGGLSAVVGTMFTEDATKTEIECAIYDFTFDQGIVKPRLAVLDTRYSTVFADGEVDLKQEKLNLKISPDAKGVTLSVAFPVRLKGTLRSPDVDIEKTGALLKAGELWATVAYPPTALINFSSLVEGRDNPCVTMVAEKAGIPIIEDVGRILEGTVKSVGGAVKGVGSGVGKFIDAVKAEAEEPARTGESVEADADDVEIDELDDPDLFMDY